MSDVISRKALIEKLKKSIKWCEDNLESSTASFQSGCIAAIKDVISTVKMEETCPSVDAVEVVRCKECRNYTADCYCKVHDNYVMYDNDFCSCGECKEVTK
ncbi:MAG: hypothetical protein KBS43_04615 [Oscillospiraceae bacterium]|nr:hypothetical protein [Candidatus Limimonas coprohippi]